MLLAECSAERAGAECSAERASAALGMVNLAVFERMPSPERADSRWAYLANAYVRPEHRDRGVGAALVEAAVEAARDRGCARVVLSPSERSVPLYQRAGFGPATMLMAQTLQGAGHRSAAGEVAVRAGDDLLGTIE